MDWDFLRSTVLVKFREPAAINFSNFLSSN